MIDQSSEEMARSAAINVPFFNNKVASNARLQPAGKKSGEQSVSEGVGHGVGYIIIYPIMAERSQWLFPISALLNTPTATTSNVTLERELYDRARGVEFLFRLGSSLALSVASFRTAFYHYVLLTPFLFGPDPLQPSSLLQRGSTVSICGTQWKIFIAK
jgi:hypothetical protein